MMNKTLLTAALALSALLILPSASAPKVAVKDLTTELRKDPEGIDCATPRLSWKVVSKENKTLQTAYQIVVSGPDGKKVWDSGKVPSFESVLVPYGGPALQPESASTASSHSPEAISSYATFRHSSGRPPVARS